LNLSLHEHPAGFESAEVETAAGNRVVYDVARNEAHFGVARVDRHALVWEIGGSGEGALLSREVDLDPAASWLARCDRIDFPPGGVAYTHTHPGPGIRYLLHGAIEIETAGHTTTFGPGEAWFESGPDPVYATASATEDTAFVRVLLLPVEWEGKRTIRYVDPADEDKPKLQRATVFFDRRLAS
jgi:quercetin dioxygenase-like cupin family protein